MIEKNKLISYLENLCNTYSPVCLDIAGRWVGGDEKLFWFCKELKEQIEAWEEK